MWGLGWWLACNLYFSVLGSVCKVIFMVLGVLCGVFMHQVCQRIVGLHHNFGGVWAKMCLKDAGTVPAHLAKILAASVKN